MEEGEEKEKKKKKRNGWGLTHLAVCAIGCSVAGI
jgi:hypothetical protein